MITRVEKQRKVLIDNAIEVSNYSLYKGKRLGNFKKQLQRNNEVAAEERPCGHCGNP